MGQESATQAGVLGRALLEAVGSLAEPALARGIVSEVLQRHDLTTIPEEVAAFRALVEGPILAQVTRLLGVDAGESMMEQLEPVIEMASSQLRRGEPGEAGKSGVPPSTGPRPVYREDRRSMPVARMRRESAPLDDARETAQARASGSAPARSASAPVGARMPSAPAQRSSVPLPLVLVVSFDQNLCWSIGEQLRGIAQVRMVEMTMELVAAVESKGPTPIVIYDDAAAPINAETLDWLQSLVDAPLPVVLCGADADRRRALEHEAPAASTWTRIEGRDAATIAACVARLARDPG